MSNEKKKRFSPLQRFTVSVEIKKPTRDLLTEMAVVLHTTSGDLPVLLYYQTAPLASFNFLALCAAGYYDGCQFYRHFPGILLQTGDPTNNGKGGESVFARLPQPTLSSSSSPSSSSPAAEGGVGEENAVTAAIRAAGVEAGRYFRDEGLGETSHAQRGVLSMAHRGTKPDTNASQFFITVSPQPSFDRMYTAFGVVDLKGVYDASSMEVIEGAANTPAPSAETDAKDAAGGVGGMTGESVLRALEEAAGSVDAKNFVKNAADVRINSVTVLYNPFAEGKMRL